MSEIQRTRVRVLLYASFGLALSLGLAAGARSLAGEEGAGAVEAGVETPLLEQAATATPQSTQEFRDIAADPATLATVSLGMVEIAKMVTPAVVSVDTRGTPAAPITARIPRPLEEFFPPPQQHQQESPFDAPLGRGSGFIVSDDGYILTNNHVVARAERIEVELQDGRSLPAKLVGRDPTTDVAVLKIEARNLPTVELGDPEAAQVGELVLAIGNPGASFSSAALPFTVTSGIISAKGRRLGIIQQTAGSEYAIEDLIQTDAVINPGNSGGPLVNHRGEVIGINTAIASVTGYYQGYGFAIPISLARDVMEDLIEHGRVRRAALGVQVDAVSRADARVYGLGTPRGVLVQGFTDGSPAEKAGIEAEDVIVAVEAKPVNRVGQLQRLIASYEPGDRVKVSVVRFGESKDLTVRLTEAEVPQPEQATASETRPSTTLLGVRVRTLTPDLVVSANLPEPFGSLEGVIVSEVARFGPAEEAGIARGTVIQRVNGQDVSNVEEFDGVLEALKPGAVVSLQAVVGVRNDGSLAWRVINIELPRE